MLEGPHSYLGYVCGLFHFTKIIGGTKMRINWMKSTIRIGLIVCTVSAIGGGVYLADQEKSRIQEDTVEAISVESPSETYIKKVYLTYMNEVVPKWNEISNNGIGDQQEVESAISKWQSLLSEQDSTYVALNTPIQRQLDTLGNFLVLSQEEMTSEQRKGLRTLSTDFLDGHEAVKEGLLQVLKEQGAVYSVTPDGTIEYQFNN